MQTLIPPGNFLDIPHEFLGDDDEIPHDEGVTDVVGFLVPVHCEIIDLMGDLS